MSLRTVKFRHAQHWLLKIDKRIGPEFRHEPAPPRPVGPATPQALPAEPSTCSGHSSWTIAQSTAFGGASDAKYDDFTYLHLPSEERLTRHVDFCVLAFQSKACHEPSSRWPTWCVKYSCEIRLHDNILEKAGLAILSDTCRNQARLKICLPYNILRQRYSCQSFVVLGLHPFVIYACGLTIERIRRGTVHNQMLPLPSPRRT